MFEQFLSEYALMSRYERKSLFAQSMEKETLPDAPKASKRAARKAQKKARAITRKTRKGGK